MPQLDDRQQDARFISLFVGRSGSGKTVAECSFDKPIHVDDFDGRIGGAQGLEWQDTKGVEYDPYPPLMPNLIGALNEKLELLNTARVLGQPLPKTWIVDSITNQTSSFITQALKITHLKQASGKPGRGKYLGAVAMPGPEDFGLEAQVTYDYISFIKSMPFNNIIVSAHLIQMYGKQDPDNDFSPSVVIGEKLSIRDKIGENIMTHFDHIFKFERITEGDQEKFYVTFRGGIARSSYSWLPTGRQDWTKRKFKDFMMSFQPKGETNVASNQ